MLAQSPLDPAFVQDPYPVYAQARRDGPVLFWEDYGMLAAFDHATCHALFRDKRLGREIPVEKRADISAHLAPFHAFDQHSMLELEPPRHTRLRNLVLRAFTSRRVAALEPDIIDITQDALRSFPKDGADLIPAVCQMIPVRVIARLLGVPESMADTLLRWSTDMVAMYQAGRDRSVENAAVSATTEFSDFLRGYVEKRRATPADDLITHLIAAEDDGTRLSPDELISTCILLLNAGHEATVHSMGNAVKCLTEHDTPPAALGPDRIDATVEELLRFDPPLHMFTRHVYAPVAVGPHTLEPGDEVALVLGAAGRDPAVWDVPDRFDPARKPKTHLAFGGGLHFCVGAPLARAELRIALPAIFDAIPGLKLLEPPRYANSYHFHKLDRLIVGAAIAATSSST